jgi:ferredoxin
VAHTSHGNRVKVRFLPGDHTVNIEAGTTLLDAALAVNLPVGNSCGADGTCGRCGLRLVAGTLPPPSPREIRVAKANRLESGLRLSCMVEPDSDIEVTADYW